MKYPAHVVGGITTGVAAHEYILVHLPVMSNSNLPTLLFSATFIAGSVIGSLLPDIDHRWSYLGRRLPILSFLTNATLGHRGGTHAPLIAILIATLSVFSCTRLLYGAQELFVLFAIAGCFFGSLNHMLLDALTKAGIPLFFPFSKEHYRLTRFKTGGIAENIITFLMILLTVGILLKRFH